MTKRRYMSDRTFSLRSLVRWTTRKEFEECMSRRESLRVCGHDARGYEEAVVQNHVNDYVSGVVYHHSYLWLDHRGSTDSY